ncbi:MAG: tail fiber protein [Bacteroidales bacterium]|nr:tail fiber protein [Bacteroidales bacterium]
MENYIGEIRAFAFGRTPEGWLPCEGQTLQVRDYNALFALISNRYGGDARTTFMLPDLRGKSPLGYGISESNTLYPMAQYGGQEFVTLTNSHIPLHSHSLSVGDALGTGIAAAGTLISKEATFTSITGEKINTYVVHPVPPTNTVVLSGVNTTGSSTPHENRTPSLAVQLCIATQGYWPSRS